MDDEAFGTLRPRQLPHDLQSWNLEDLSDYIVNLKEEFSRVENAIAEKKSVTDAAASLFKS